MKIKKRLKYKSTLPKADYGMDPGEGLSMANAALGGINTGLGALSAFTPKDNNDGIGISHKTSNITSGITGGLDAASGIASSIPGVGQAVGAGLGIVSKFITMIKGAVDHKSENDRSITSRLARKEYDPTNNNTGYSFGNGTAKYGMPLFGDGGSIKYDSNFRPATSYEQKYNKETGLWEVSGAKPKSTPVKQTTKPNKVEPIYVDNPKDKRLQSYNDSLSLYNNSKIAIGKNGNSSKNTPVYVNKHIKANEFMNSDYDFVNQQLLDISGKFNVNMNPNNNFPPPKVKQTIMPIGGIGINEGNSMGGWYNIYKKPVQPVIYKKKKVEVPVPKVNYLKNLPIEQDSKIDLDFPEQQAPNEDLVTKGNPIPDYLIQLVKAPNGMKTYIRKDRNSPWIEQYKNGGEPNIDSTLNANKNLEWVNRLYDQNPQSIQVQGQKYPSTHLLTQTDNFVYPEVVKGPDGKLEHLSGEEAYHFAMKNKTAIPFKSEKDALWFTNHYKEGTGVLKGFALGGFINKNKINNSLSNGMFSPDGKFFSSPEQYQQYQSLYNPQFQLQQPIMNNYGTLKMKSDFKNNSFFELGGDPRAQSNIEAEGEEAMLHSNNQVENIEGPSHEEINTKLGGKGVPIKVQPSHEYIFSNSLGRDKNGNITLNEKDVVKSFADDAKSIQRRYSKREGDSIVDKTKELELAFLKQDAEQARVAKEEIEMGKQIKKYKAKYGADLKKFGNSGYTQYGVIPSGKQPSQEDDILTIQKRMLQADPNALPKYGADGSWGTESQTAFDKLSPQIGGAPQFTFNTNSSTIPLFGGGVNPNPFIGPKPFNPSRRDNLHEAANFYTPGQVGTPRMATPSIDQRSTAPEVADKVKNGMFSSLTTGDKMQLASMLPAFGFNMGMGLRKADVEPNRKNLYEKDVVNIMQNRKFDIQNYLNQSNLATNTAKEDIGNNSTSVGGKMANLQKLYANQLGTLGDITTKGQEMNNQYRAEEANTKNILGEANRAESIRAAGINDQNKARKQQFLAKAFEQMGQGLATTGQSANQSLTNKLLIKSLSEISPDFDVKNMKDIEVDNEGYIVFKGQKTEFKMSDEGKIVMAGGTPNTANAIKSQYAPKDFIMKTFANFTKAKTK